MFFPGTILYSSIVQKAISDTIDDQSKDSFCKTSENYIVLSLKLDDWFHLLLIQMWICCPYVQPIQ